MRLAFNLVILAGAVFYAWIGFTELALLTPNGRLGPGFFPRVIGVALIATILYSMVVDRRSERLSDGSTSNGRDIVVFTAFAVMFVALLKLTGGLLAMVIFMLAALSFFNRGKHLHNVLLSVLLPAAVFLMFDTWLNAGLPEGLLAFLGS